MKKLHHMKHKLIDCVHCQMEHLESVDTKELGEAIDMIKDLSEAIYYCTITDAMEEEGEDSDKQYYPARAGSDGHGTWHSPEQSMHHEEMTRSPHEGRSGLIRKNYIESKEMHNDKTVQMQELEKYAQELTNDLMEMIEQASSEERQFLSNKIATLAMKIK